MGKRCWQNNRVHCPCRGQIQGPWTLQLRSYLQNHVIFFDRNDRDYQKIGVRKMLIATGLRPPGFGQSAVEKHDTPLKQNGGVHWMAVFDSADVRDTALTNTMTKCLKDRGYMVGEFVGEEGDETKENESHVTIVTTADALLVVLTDHVFTKNVSIIFVPHVNVTFLLYASFTLSVNVLLNSE